jgi:hypothetical protein
MYVQGKMTTMDFFNANVDEWMLKTEFGVSFQLGIRSKKLGVTGILCTVQTLSLNRLGRHNEGKKEPIKTHFQAERKYASTYGEGE